VHSVVDNSGTFPDVPPSFVGFLPLVCFDIGDIHHGCRLFQYLQYPSQGLFGIHLFAFVQ